MKKTILLPYLILCGCAVPAFITKPSETIENPECLDITQIKIFQITDFGALGLVCIDNCNSYLASISHEGTTFYYDKRFYGLEVFVSHLNNDDLYFEQILQPDSNHCFVSDGVHQKITDNYETVIKQIKFGDRYIHNPEYDEWQKKHTKDENSNE